MAERESANEGIFLALPPSRCHAPRTAKKEIASASKFVWTAKSSILI